MTTTTTPTTNPPTILIPRHPTPPLSPPLHTALQTALLTPPTIRTLRQTLESTTKAQSWQEAVKQRTLQLLASREYWRYEDLVGVIVREARGVDEFGDGGGEGEVEEGEGEGKEDVQDGRAKGRVDIKIPEKAITEAAVVVKGVLVEKVELEAEGKGFWD